MSPSPGSRSSNSPSGGILVPLFRPAAVLAGLVALLLVSSAFAAPPADSTESTPTGPLAAGLMICGSAASVAATSDFIEPLCPPTGLSQARWLATTYLPRKPSLCQVQIGPGTVLDRQWVYTLRREEKRLGIRCDIVRLPPNSRDELDGR